MQQLYEEKIVSDTIRYPDVKRTRIEFKADSYYTIQDFTNDYRNLLGLTKDDSLHLVLDVIGRNDLRDYRYQQFYKGIEVNGAQVLLHENRGTLYGINGIWIKNLNLNVTPSISEKMALDIALKEINAEKYYWQDTAREQRLKKIKKDTRASYFPKGKLILRSIPFSTKPEKFKLTYKFDIYPSDPSDAMRVYVDAFSGKIIQKHTLIIN